MQRNRVEIRRKLDNAVGRQLPKADTEKGPAEVMREITANTVKRVVEIFDRPKSDAPQVDQQ